MERWPKGLAFTDNLFMTVVQGGAFHLILLLCFLSAANGFVRPELESLPNIDKRKMAPPEQPIADPSIQSQITNLQRRVAITRINLDHISGSPRLVSAKQGFLTGSNGQGLAVLPSSLRAIPANDRHRITKAFLNEHAALYGFNSQALDTARLKTDSTTEHNGLRTCVWQQQLDEVPVFEALLISHITKRDELVRVSSHFLRDLPKAAEKAAPHRAMLKTAPSVSAAQAIAIAAADLGEKVLAVEITSVDAAPVGSQKRQRFKAKPLRGETHAALTWLPMDSSTVRLCWDVILTSGSRGEMYRELIDAQTGEIMVRNCLTKHFSNASYRVFTSDSPSPLSPGCPTPCTTQPPIVQRNLITVGALSSQGSPNGWINDGDNTTIGNNVDAHLDRDANDDPDPGSRPIGNPSRTFDFPLDLTQDPEFYANASVVQLFYWNNWMHDKLYDLGFTEALGNFQADNFGRGGLGGDAVQADAQESADLAENEFNRNQALFHETPDGIPPRMELYIFDGPSPDRDSDLDAEVVLHEYTHGLTSRLVGGGAGITRLQSIGLGEGWSDFYALSLLSVSGDDPGGNYAAGA